MTSADRLIQVRRNRLLSLNQSPDTDYVDEEKVKAEVAHARRMFADNGWPVLDVTRRSIEETAAAIINLFNERELAQVPCGVTLILASQSSAGSTMLRAAGVEVEAHASAGR